MVYVTSDLHGQFDKLLRLLEGAGFDDADQLYVLGDVIDRNGDGGVAMLKWMMHRPNVKLILGNHEAMLLKCTFLLEPITQELLDGLTPEEMALAELWMENGAEPTLTALKEWLYEEPAAKTALLAYLRSAPVYVQTEVKGQAYLMVHGGLEPFSLRKKLTKYSTDEMLWARPKADQTYFKDIYTILGHTPTDFYGEAYRGRAYVTDTWMNIDTGAAAPDGNPMLLRLDDRQTFYL